MKANEQVGIKWLFNVCFTTGEIPAEWRRGVIVLIWKGKGDIHDSGRYRGNALLNQALKFMEGILDARTRRVESKIGENQLGLRKGRGTVDVLFAIRQIIEKRREFRKDVAFDFVDMKKAFDTVPRELAFAVMRWMEVGKAEVRMVEEMYKETTAVVKIEGEISEQFGVAVGLRQGSALSPLLFIMVMNLISGKVSEPEELKKILYADDLAVVADNNDDLAVVADKKEDLQEALQEWNNTFSKHGLRMNLEKTKVMWIGEQEVDLHVVVDGKTIKQVNSVVYLGGTVCEDGGSSKEI